MKAQRCPVRECGAVVYLLPLERGEVAVDPRPLEVYLPEGDQYRLAEAYRPHWATCADIAQRARFHARART